VLVWGIFECPTASIALLSEQKQLCREESLSIGLLDPYDFFQGELLLLPMDLTITYRHWSEYSISTIHNDKRIRAKKGT